jgi:hypothetical protein
VLAWHTREADKVTHHVNAAPPSGLQTCARLANQILILRTSSASEINEKYSILAEIFKFWDNMLVSR